MLFKNRKPMVSNNLMGIVLAGGEGVRLQNFVTGIYGQPRPKQYCTFTGTRSMFKHTIDRVSLLIPPRRILTVVNNNHKQFIDTELKKSPELIILEQPCMRDTAAGILYPLLKINHTNPSATVAI
ncbi:MAG: sugar phosphate nucleotidyltransferase, partial [Melioribacteraceae bacterium]